jgi:hypothetical protein
MSLFPNRNVKPPRPISRVGATPGSWIVETSVAGAGGGSVGAAPPVTITGQKVIPRETDLVEVDVTYTADASATANNYAGAAVFIEDPDISSGAEAPLDGSTSLDGSAQVSGQWNPQRDQNTTKSPVAVLIPEGDVDRSVRIYLAAFGPNSTPQLVRANDTTQTPTPSVVVTIPAVSSTYVSGMEVAWLVTNAGVTVNTEYNLAPPLYTLTFSYTPPTPEQEAHRPPGLSAFGGVAIWYKYFDSGRLIQAMQHPFVATAATVGQVQSWKSTEYPASKGSFRVYFVSTDVGGDQNSIVDGITPSVDITIDPTPAAPKVTNLQIVPGSAQVIYLLDGSFVLEATFSWVLPTTNLVRYAGMFLYRVATTGTAPVPAQIWSQMSATDTQATPQIQNVPVTPETWTIAAISVDFNGQLEDDPKTYGSPTWTSPVVAWTVGPPGIGVMGGGEEYAPLVTVNAGATVVPTESTSSDGVRMVTFAINGTNGAWSPPASNQFGGVSVALVVNGDISQPIIWQVPQGQNKFTTPAIPSPGPFGFGVPVPLQFYLLSRDPQGNRNSLETGKTPFIAYTYTPTEGVIIPSRNPLTPQWFSSEFFWDPNSTDLTVSGIGAGKIQVGSLLQVGGKNSFSTTSQAGQIGVFDSNSKMVGWIGVAQVSTGQQPQNTVGSNNYGGAWFGQLWVGGDSPAHAPLWIDPNGIVQVGGIAAAAGSPYPYISLRDNYGTEMGRMGAMLTNPPHPGDGGAVQTVPVGITSGAWFNQFAAGGKSTGNWQVLIDGSGKFYIRDTDQFSIGFAANNSTPPYNSAYTILMGKGIWSGVGSSNNTYQFPGIMIYEGTGAPANASQIFGSVFLNRGLVLRGTSSQNYGIITSLAMVNGNSQGSDFPSQFWGWLAMYSPVNPSTITVSLSSGGAIYNPDGSVQSIFGDSSFYLYNHAALTNFSVDTNGNVVLRGTLSQGSKSLVDASGNWVGGGGSAVASVSASGPGISVNPTMGAVVISNTGVTQISGGTGVSVSGTGTVVVSLNSAATVSFAGYTNGSFTGAGVNVGANGVGCGSVSCTGQITGEALAINPSGTTDAFTVSGKKCCDYNGTWSGNGLQANAQVAASQFGIFGQGWANAGISTFKSADGKTVTVNGGLVMSVV